jgi:hypothetical protein
MISYESSKWYVKMWRNRWYLYAIFLYIKELLHVEIFLEYLLETKLNKNQEKKLKKDWLYIKKHVELSKMLKLKHDPTLYREEE